MLGGQTWHAYKALHNFQKCHNFHKSLEFIDFRAGHPNNSSLWWRWLWRLEKLLKAIRLAVVCLAHKPLLDDEQCKRTVLWGCPMQIGHRAFSHCLAMASLADFDPLSDLFCIFFVFSDSELIILTSQFVHFTFEYIWELYTKNHVAVTLSKTGHE